MAVSIPGPGAASLTAILTGDQKAVDKKHKKSPLLTFAKKRLKELKQEKFLEED